MKAYRKLTKNEKAKKEEVGVSAFRKQLRGAETEIRGRKARGGNGRCNIITGPRRINQTQSSGQGKEGNKNI